MTTLAELLTMASGPQDYGKPGFTTNDIFAHDGMEGGDTGALALAQKYDPNARIGDDGTLWFDRSKIPAPVAPQLQDLGRFDQGGGKGGNFWDAYSALTPDGKGNYTGNGGADVNDLSKVIHDPNYGDFVAKQYMGQAAGDSTSGFMGQLGKYAPAAISTIMSMGMGAAAGPLIGGLLSGTLGPGGIGNKLAMGEPVDWGKTATNMGISALGSVLPGMLPDGAAATFKSISPYVNLGRGIYGAAKGNIGSGVGAGITLAQILNGAGHG